MHLLRRYRGLTLLLVIMLVVNLLGCSGGGSKAGPQTSGSSARAAEVVSPAQSQLLGDMDDDGAATVGDAIKILRIVVGLDADDECADANENGSTDVGDAIKVLRCVVGLDDWPIGECSETTVSAHITASEGGTIAVAQHEVNIPGNALSEDTTVTVTVMQTTSDVLTGMTLEPSGLAFERLVDVRLHLPEQVRAGAIMRVLTHVGGATEQARLDDGQPIFASVSSDGTYAVFPIDHFSDYYLEKLAFATRLDELMAEAGIQEKSLPGQAVGGGPLVLKLPPDYNYDVVDTMTGGAIYTLAGRKAKYVQMLQDLFLDQPEAEQTVVASLIAPLRLNRADVVAIGDAGSFINAAARSKPIAELIAGADDVNDLSAIQANALKIMEGKDIGTGTLSVCGDILLALNVADKISEIVWDLAVLQAVDHAMVVNRINAFDTLLPDCSDPALVQAFPEAKQQVLADLHNWQTRLAAALWSNVTADTTVLALDVLAHVSAPIITKFASAFIGGHVAGAAPHLALILFSVHVVVDMWDYEHNCALAALLFHVWLDVCPDFETEDDLVLEVNFENALSEVVLAKRFFKLQAENLNGAGFAGICGRIILGIWEGLTDPERDQWRRDRMDLYQHGATVLEDFINRVYDARYTEPPPSGDVPVIICALPATGHGNQVPLVHHRR